MVSGPPCCPRQVEVSRRWSRPAGGNWPVGCSARSGGRSRARLSVRTESRAGESTHGAGPLAATRSANISSSSSPIWWQSGKPPTLPQSFDIPIIATPPVTSGWITRPAAPWMYAIMAAPHPQCQAAPEDCRRWLDRLITPRYQRGALNPPAFSPLLSALPCRVSWPLSWPLSWPEPIALSRDEARNHSACARQKKGPSVPPDASLSC